MTKKQWKRGKVVEKLKKAFAANCTEFTDQGLKDEDSLDFVELIMKIEDEFDIEIDDSDDSNFPKPATIDALVDQVMAVLEA